MSAEKQTSLALVAIGLLFVLLLHALGPQIQELFEKDIPLFMNTELSGRINPLHKRPSR